jgi:hypothetical protein
MPKGNTSKSKQKQKRQIGRSKDIEASSSLPRKEASTRAWSGRKTQAAVGKKSVRVNIEGASPRKASSQRGRVASERSLSGRSTGARKPASRKAAPSRSRRSRG